MTRDLEVKKAAIKLLCQLRGMDEAELSSDEISWTIVAMDKVYSAGWLAGVTSHQYSLAAAKEEKRWRSCSDGNCPEQ
jgi:hypothetical protein